MAAGPILVTGGSGLLGRSLRAVLPEALYPTRAELDLRDGPGVLRALQAARPAVVVHLAARVGGIAANIAAPADFLLENLLMDAHLCAALRVVRPRHLVAVLSTCMYPDRLADAAYPLTEAAIEAGPPPPTNAAYAQAKRSLWHACRALHAQYDLPYTAVVPANLYGPHDHYGAAAAHFLAAALPRLVAASPGPGTSLDFFGTGRARRQYVYAPDLARLLAQLARGAPHNEALNVAPEGDASIATLAAAAAAAAGFVGEIRFTGEGPDGQLRKDVSSARLRAVVPEYGRDETPLAVGLRACARGLRRH